MTRFRDGEQPAGRHHGGPRRQYLVYRKTTPTRSGAFIPSTHVFGQFAIPSANSQPIGITTGPDGNIWFTENNTNKIGSINPGSHVISETSIPTASSSPAEITAGPGGTLWFTETNGSNIGDVVATPTITANPVSQTIIEGQSTTLTATAAGFPTPTVLWQVSTNAGATFTPLANAGVYSGVNTGTLTITGATTALSGAQFQAVFSNGVSPTPTAATAVAILTVNPVLSISPAPSQGVINTSYNQTISVVGSTAPFTLFSVNNFSAGGTGLTLANIVTNSVNGTITISGTPPGTRLATGTIAVANTAGNSLTQTLTLTINPPLSIATASLPQATGGMNYNQTINVIGGVKPYTTFSVTNFSGGATGLTAAQITAASAAGTFQINGTPTAGGTVTFTVNVTDSAGTALTKNFTITVNPPLAITASLPQGTAGTTYKPGLPTVTQAVCRTRPSP